MIEIIDYLTNNDFKKFKNNGMTEDHVEWFILFVLEQE